MKALEELKKRPVTTGLTLASFFLLFVVWQAAAPTFEFIVRIQRAPDVAQAAMQEAQKATEWIEWWKQQQEKQLELDQQRYKLEQDYNQQLMEMQRQMQKQWQTPPRPVYPNLPQQPTYPPQPAPQQRPQPQTWTDESGQVWCYDEQEYWPHDPQWGCDE